MPSPSKPWRGLLIVLLLAAPLLTVYFAYEGNMLDRLLIYFPDTKVSETPDSLGLEYEDVYFSSPEGLRLNGWFIPGSKDVTLLWLHGNAGNISHRLDNIALVHETLGVSVFIIDYRGYGLSQGAPSEEGLYADAEAALSYLRSRDDVDPNKVALFGRSLGAGVAVELATRHSFYALILESPFTSVKAMAARTYPVLSRLLMGFTLVRGRYDSISKIGEVDCPVLVLHGDRDRVVPLEMGRELFEAATEPKGFYIIEGAGHNDTYIAGGEDYFQALKEFLEDPYAVAEPGRDSAP